MSIDTETAPRLSVVSTLYRSAATIDEFIDRTATSARALVGESFEIVIVNDGSPDDSLDRAEKRLADVPQLVLVDLSRNFGHHAALLEGIRQSRGELVYLIDSDLEEHPEWVADFANRLRAERADVIFGYQEQRKGGWFERLSGEVHWKLFRALTGLNVPANILTCRLMARRYVEAVMLHEEREMNIGGIFAVTGFKQVGVPVAKSHKGSSSYSLRLKIWHFVNSISSFSTKPLNFIFILGSFVSFVGLLLVAYLVLAKIFWGRSPLGWTSVIASVWLLGGLIIASLGVIAIYLGKVLSEVKGRPRSIVRSIVRAARYCEEARGRRLGA